MTLKQLISGQKENSYWTSNKVFICYSNDKILRLKALGKHIADGELFDLKDLDEYDLNMELSPNQWWIEDGDLCVDPYRRG